MEKYITISTYHRVPALKDFLNYTGTEIVCPEDSDYVTATFYRSGNRIMSKSVWGHDIIAYYQDPTVHDFGKDVWISRRKSYMEFFNSKGDKIATKGREVFIPQKMFVVRKNGKDITLFPDKEYDLFEDVYGDGYIHSDGEVIYKPFRYWYDRGVVLERWSNADARFDNGGNLVFLSFYEL